MDADGRIVGASERASKETPRGTFVTAAAADGRTDWPNSNRATAAHVTPPARPSLSPSVTEIAPVGSGFSFNRGSG